MTYSQLISRLETLLENEHCHGDPQLTDDIAQSYQYGFSLWSLYLWDSCGAASEEFCILYAKLTRMHGKRFMKAAERERNTFVDTVAHDQCQHCNAIVWHDDCHDGDVNCESCGRDFSIIRGSR